MRIFYGFQSVISLCSSLHCRVDRFGNIRIMSSLVSIRHQPV